LLRNLELPSSTAVEADEGTYKYLGYVSHNWLKKKNIIKTEMMKYDI